MINPTLEVPAMPDPNTSAVSIAELVSRINAAVVSCPQLMVTRQSIRDYCKNGTIQADRVPGNNPLSHKVHWMIPGQEADRVVQMFIDRCKEFTGEN